MLLWLLGVGVFVVLSGALWKANPKAGYGALVGFRRGVDSFLSS